MHRKALKTVAALLIALPFVFGTVARSQGQGRQPASKFLAPPSQVVAVRAGRLFDAKSGTM